MKNTSTILRRASDPASWNSDLSSVLLVNRTPFSDVMNFFKISLSVATTTRQNVCRVRNFLDSRRFRCNRIWWPFTFYSKRIKFKRKKRGDFEGIETSDSIYKIIQRQSKMNFKNSYNIALTTNSYLCFLLLICISLRRISSINFQFMQRTRKNFEINFVSSRCMLIFHSHLVLKKKHLQLVYHEKRRCKQKKQRISVSKSSHDCDL